MVNINPLSNIALQQALFTRADADRNGSINVAEAKSLGAVFLNHATATPGEAQAIVQALDTDKNGSVSENEFISKVSVPVSSEAGTLSALLGTGAPSTNPYSALTGFNAADAANLYASMVSNSFAGTYNSQGALTGELLAGNLTARNLLV